MKETQPTQLDEDFLDGRVRPDLGCPEQQPRGEIAAEAADKIDRLSIEEHTTLDIAAIIKVAIEKAYNIGCAHGYETRASDERKRLREFCASNAVSSAIGELRKEGE